MCVAYFALGLLQLSMLSVTKDQTRTIGTLGPLNGKCCSGQLGQTIKESFHGQNEALLKIAQDLLGRLKNISLRTVQKTTDLSLEPRLAIQ